MSDEETLQGAQNRAAQAMKQGRAEFSDLDPSTYLAIGLEGGVTMFAEDLWSTVWVAVLDIEGRCFTANGARMKLAPQIAQPILNGEEMGPVMERLMGVDNIRQKQGMLGVVTKNYVTRAEEYGGIAKLAIGLWYGRDWVKDIIGTA
jgi:non-canonical (house-cleaning) NTP pyrophosphatase